MDITQFWDGWTPILHTLVTAVAGYLALVVLLRISGARTMASMTPLDVVIAVTLGSAFGRTVTAVDVPLAQAVLALVVLVALQWTLAWFRARSPRIRRALDDPPVLLYYRGQFQRQQMRRHQLVEDDVHTAVRSSSRGSLQGVAAVVLEANGSLLVIGEDTIDDASSVLPFTAQDKHNKQ